MNSCNVDQEQKTIDLDVDSGTGSYIRSMADYRRTTNTHMYYEVFPENVWM